MRLAKLTICSLRRLWRSRPLRLAAIGIPVAMAGALALFPRVKDFAALLWLCPMCCVLVLGGALFAQDATDRATGLADALHSSNVSAQRLVISRVLALASALAVQMAVFFIIVALRF